MLYVQKLCWRERFMALSPPTVRFESLWQQCVIPVTCVTQNFPAILFALKESGLDPYILKFFALSCCLEILHSMHNVCCLVVCSLWVQPCRRRLSSTQKQHTS